MANSSAGAVRSSRTDNKALPPFYNKIELVRQKHLHDVDIVGDCVRQHESPNTIIFDKALTSKITKVSEPLPLVEEVRCEGLEVTSLPDSFALLFPSATRVVIRKCTSFSELASAAFHKKIRSVTCIDCPSVTSLSSLVGIPTGSELQHLSFTWCGLSVDKGDDWTVGLNALSGVTHNLVIEIAHCDTLSRLPSSIALLRASRCGEIALTLNSNANLTEVPPSLGEVTNLKSLTISNCPELKSLPWQLLRLPPHTTFVLLSMPSVIAKLGLRGESASFRRFDRNFVRYLRRTKARNGALLLGVFVGALRHKAIAPGGCAYRRAKKSFESLAKRRQQKVDHSIDHKE